VQDARLTQLIAAAGAGPLEALLMGLGIQWAGPPAVLDRAPDPGLAIWCGLDPLGSDPVTGILDGLRLDESPEFEGGLLELLRARRAADLEVFLENPESPEFR